MPGSVVIFRGSVFIFRSQKGSASERVWETLKLNCIQGFSPYRSVNTPSRL